MFCRLRQCRQILPKLNLSAILLLFLIKRAALGNLKVNFHCAHLHRFFPLKKGLSKTHQSSLTLKGGSTSHLGLLPSGKKRKPLLSIVFTTPSVPLVGDRNVALNHFILWLADHQRSTPAAELRFFVRDKPQGHGGMLLMRPQEMGIAADGNAGTQCWMRWW